MVGGDPDGFFERARHQHRVDGDGERLFSYPPSTERPYVGLRVEGSGRCQGHGEINNSERLLMPGPCGQPSTSSSDALFGADADPCHSMTIAKG